LMRTVEIKHTNEIKSETMYKPVVHIK
jgi:hypothetical protein